MLDVRPVAETAILVALMNEACWTWFRGKPLTACVKKMFQICPISRRYSGDHTCSLAKQSGSAQCPLEASRSLLYGLEAVDSNADKNIGAMNNLRKRLRA